MRVLPVPITKIPSGCRLALLIAALLLAASPECAAQSESSNHPAESHPSLPEAPQAQPPDHAGNPAQAPCPAKIAGSGAPAPPASGAGNPAEGAKTQAPPCPPPEPPIAPLEPFINWYARFLDGPKVKRMTPKEKAWLAVRNVADPFNGLTILGSSAIAVGANSHSPYGPGMTGFGKYVGVSYSQDLTGEFFGTFLIPSIVHQDPHYHRMPNATLKRRIAHCLYQVVWTQGDGGKGMVNYADVAGFAIDDAIGNLYVPGRETSLRASAARYAIDMATAPADNLVTEFFPDIARRIHVRVVLIQRIINQVAKTETANGQP